MSADPILGPMGTPLADAARACLADADAASVFEQARWARRAAVLTPTGGLVRAVDLGHAPGFAVTRYLPGEVQVTRRPCQVCGQGWPCSSSLLEVGWL